MKNIFSSKKNIVAISVLLLVIITSILSLLYVNNSCNIEKNDTQSLEQNSLLDSNSVAMSSDANEEIMPLSSASSPNVYIEYDEAHAMDRIKEIISKNYHKIEFESISKHESVYFLASNISQSFLNNLYKLDCSENITGTCSLVAITILKKTMETVRPDMKITYPNEKFPFDNRYRTFEELFHTSTRVYGNTYEEGNCGTDRDTILPIMYYYYAIRGYFFNTADYTLSKNIRDNLINIDDVLIPFTLSINNYYDNDPNISDSQKYTSGGHSVACVGVYSFEVKYKSKDTIFNIKWKEQSEIFTTFVICNGWESSSDNKFGNNLQFLIYPDNSDFARVYSYGDWLNYEK